MVSSEEPLWLNYGGDSEHFLLTKN